MIEDNKHEIDDLEKKKQEVEQDMTDARNKKDEIIQDLTGNIDKMTQQFAKMLSETLDKMKNRIQAANEQFKLENEAKN